MLFNDLSIHPQPAGNSYRSRITGPNQKTSVGDRINSLSKCFQIILGALVICAFFGALIAAPAQAVKTQAVVPPKFNALFLQTHDWERDKATGWLTVRKEDGKVEGRVLVMLVGRSFYDTSVKGDFKIEYVGHGDNGTKHVLPKGLYYWTSDMSATVSGVERGSFLGGVRPASRNRFSSLWFYLDQGLGSDIWYVSDIFLSKEMAERPKPKQNRRYNIEWNENLEKFADPSKEIADVLAELSRG